MSRQPVIRHVPRERDEEILAALGAKRAGVNWPAVGKMLGSTPNVTQTLLSKVRNADFAESGEPEAVVRRAYW